MRLEHIRKSQKCWKDSQSGSTAVEFSLVGVPFIFMIIGILEMSLMFTSQNLLEASTNAAARLIRTGQIQQAGSEQDFTNALCELAMVFIPCEDIQYQVTPLADFGEAEEIPEASFDEEGIWKIRV